MLLNKSLQYKVNQDLEVEGNEDKSIELEYYLVESNSNKSVCNVDSYGIEISKKIDSENYEVDIVENLSISKEETIRIIDKMASNLVTPMSLKFVLDDMVGNDI